MNKNLSKQSASSRSSLSKRKMQYLGYLEEKYRDSAQAW